MGDALVDPSQSFGRSAAELGERVADAHSQEEAGIHVDGVSVERRLTLRFRKSSHVQFKEDRWASVIWNCDDI